MNLKSIYTPITFIAAIVFVGWTGFLIQLLAWNFISTNIVDFYNLPAKVLNENKQVNKGSFLEYEIEYRKFKDLPAVISRSLVNDRIITLTCESGSLPAGSRRKTTVRIFIPLNVWPGKYQLKTTMMYQVNPIRQEHESYETEWFEVVE